MQGKRVLTAVTCVAALAIGSGAASAATMHPTLGAKLAGMGEHGVVNFTSSSGKGQLCWTFDVMTHGITDRLDPRRLGHGRRQARPGVQGKELRDGVEAGARADRVEARRLQGLGRHEGPYGRAAGHPFAGMAHMSECRKEHGDGRDARRSAAPAEGRARQCSSATVVGGVSSLYWGKAVWGTISGAALARRGEHPADPERRAGGSTPSPATCRRSTRRPGGSTVGGHVDKPTSITYDAAAGAAEGRADLDVPLRHRLDGQERPLGRRPAQRRARPREPEADRARARVRLGRDPVRRLADHRSRPACTT